MADSSFQNMVFANVCRGLDHLYSDQQLCDLRVVVGNTIFECHRLVLASVSRFFQSSLTSSWRESSSREVSIEHEDVPAESFSLLMDIVYKGKEVITMETVKDVLKMSIFLQVRFLEEYCQEYMTDNIAPDNCLGIWQFAEKYELTSLSNKALSMAETDFPKVSKCSEFVQLPKAMLLMLLASQQTGEDLCRAVFRWAEGDVDTRKVHLGEFLPFVNFSELKQEYLSTLLDYLDHPFKDYVFRVITLAVKYKINTQDKIFGREVQALFRSGDSKDFEQCVMMVTGSSESGKPQAVMQAMCFPIKAQPVKKTYSLQHLPEVCGFNFATCVMGNMLYISGGSENPTFFASYIPGRNVWEVLTSMPEGREKHAMEGVSGVVYVVGGLQQGFVVQKVPAADVTAFNTYTSTWRVFCRLILAVSDAAVATLGHRLYVFGGQDAGGQATDVVQCVNTVTGFVYQAGHLPSPKCGVRALSDGGTIYMVTSEGQVLRMKENSFAETRETAMGKLKSAEAVGATNDSNEKDETVVNADKIKSPGTTTVNLVRVGQFKQLGFGFGAFLAFGKLVVCGGCSKDGLPLQGIIDVDLRSAENRTWIRRTGLLGGNFAVNVVRIPKEFLIEATATLQPLIIGDQVKLIALRTSMSAMGSLNYMSKNDIGIVKDVQPDGNITADFPNWPGYTGQASEFILVY